MFRIDIANDFTRIPGARNYSDGPFSGEEFYDKMLRARFEEALSKGEKLTVVLDGPEGYASSFLNEAFSLLGNEFGHQRTWDNLIIISTEIPKYIQKVKDSVFEKRNQRRNLAA